MYKINLHREHRNRRRERHRAAVQTALLSILLGLAALCIVALALSSHLLEERIGLLRGEVVRLEEQVQARSQAASAVDLVSARELLAVRGSRRDWYPKLAHLAGALEPGLSLVEITGVPADPAGPARMEIGGALPARRR
jgi:uncharacterized small protein (DUF1192 family)